MTVRQEAFHAMRFELYCSGIEVDPDDCVAGAVDLREAWAAGAAAERDRIRQFAEQCGAWYIETVETPVDSVPPTVNVTKQSRPFADLLGDQS